MQKAHHRLARRKGIKNHPWRVCCLVVKENASQQAEMDRKRRHAHKSTTDSFSELSRPADVSLRASSGKHRSDIRYHDKLHYTEKWKRSESASKMEAKAFLGIIGNIV